jgi:hypothetical protein
MRRNPTEPEKQLWRHLSNSQIEGFKFRRQSDLVLHRRFPMPGEGADCGGLMAIRMMPKLIGSAMRRRNLKATEHFASQTHPNPSPEGEGLREARGRS